jgi:hypothetical protein
MNGDEHELHPNPRSARVGTPQPRGGIWPTLVLALAAIPLGAAFFTSTAPSATEDLDPSWKAVLTHDLLEGRRFGRDTVFTTGPLVSLITDHPPYVPGIYQASVIGRLLLGIGAAGVLLAAGRAIHPWPLRVVGIAALAVLIPCQKEILHFAAVGALPLAFAASRRISIGWIAAAGAYAAAAAFTKNNLLFCALITLPCVLTIVAGRRGFAFAGIAAAVFMAEAVVVWAIARQNPLDLPAFLASAIDTTRGYADTMGVPQTAERRLFTIGTGIAFGLAGIAAAIARLRRRDFEGVVAMLGVLVVGGISTKLGLVRADEGHRSVMNGALLLLAFGLGADGSRMSDVLRGLTVGCAAVGLFLSTGQFGYSVARVPVSIREHVEQAFDELSRPEQTRKTHDGIRAGLAAKHSLPTLAATIGNEPVDLVGSSQGILYLANMNVRHRPTFQDYSTFTPAMNAGNAAFFERRDAPRFVLARLWSIDGRHPAISDSGSLRALMLRYRPAGAERGYVLFERSARPPAPAPLKLRSRTIRFGETVDLSDLEPGLFELSLDFRRTFAGSIRSLLERPPFLWLVVSLRLGGERQYRISESLARTPFILSPFVDSTASFLDLWGHRSRDHVTAFRLEVEDGREDELEPGVAATVWSDPFAWERLGAPEIPAAARRMAFPTFVTPPDAAEPAGQIWALSEDGAAGVLAHPTATMTWNLPAGRYRARGRYGIIRRAWEEGATDGVVFVAAAQPGGGASTDLLRRYLAPRANPADRDAVAFDVTFDLASPGRLVLRTEPGPAQNPDWDWAWWSDVAVEPLR